jgi:hypothetical protein
MQSWRPCANANKPTIAGKIPIPASSPIKSYVNLGKLEKWSTPTVLRNNPRRPEINPLEMDPKDTEAIAVNPSKAIKKNSAGPNHKET